MISSLTVVLTLLLLSAGSQADSCTCNCATTPIGTLSAKAMTEPAKAMTEPVSSSAPAVPEQPEKPKVDLVGNNLSKKLTISF